MQLATGRVSTSLFASQVVAQLQNTKGGDLDLSYRQSVSVLCSRKSVLVLACCQVCEDGVMLLGRELRHGEREITAHWYTFTHLEHTDSTIVCEPLLALLNISEHFMQST